MVISDGARLADAVLSAFLAGKSSFTGPLGDALRPLSFSTASFERCRANSVCARQKFDEAPGVNDSEGSGVACLSEAEGEGDRVLQNSLLATNGDSRPASFGIPILILTSAHLCQVCVCAARGTGFAGAGSLHGVRCGVGTRRPRAEPVLKLRRIPFE